MSVGFPKELLLQEFGSQVWFAFGTPPYLVGSALEKKEGWRDVDVRLILEDTEWEKVGFGEPDRVMFYDGKWIALCRAFTALGKEMTGLPIDFQIQPQTWANDKFKGRRSSLGVIPLRWKESPDAK